MARKKDRHEREVEEITNYYQLNTDAVDRLVNAEKDAVPEIPAEEELLTKSGFFSKIPAPVKALFLKYWIFGAACFFFYWGLGVFVQDNIVLIIVLGFAIGVLTDLICNKILRFIANYEGEYNNFMLLPMNKFWTIFLNVLFYLFIVALVVMTYNQVNLWIIKAQKLPVNSVVIGVEPFLFGLVCLAYDMIFIGIKDLIVYLVKHKKVKY